MSLQTELRLFDDPPRVEEMVSKREDQWFDRKSFRIEPAGLAIAMIGFANADGGRIAVGIDDKTREVEGVDSNGDHLNDLMAVGINHCDPPVRHTHTLLPCQNRRGVTDRILVLDVEASEQVHRSVRQECYLRVGDKTRKLSPDEERELVFDKKGEAQFDSSIVKGLTRNDLDMASIEAYAARIGATSVKSLLNSRGLYLDLPSRNGVTQAGLLLFGVTPPIWSYIRYLRYIGTTEETGIRANLSDDVLLEGTIPDLIERAKTLVGEKIGTVVRQTPTGRFERVPTLPEFAWLEAIVNAVTHRSYSLQGDGIRIKEFDDRLVVESPGRLPGLVRVQNIQNMRYSRNPHIARVLAEMTGYVRELNEGVRRMFEEMERFGLRPPAYSITEGSVRVTLFKQPDEARRLQAERMANQLAVLEKRLGGNTLYKLLDTLKQRQGVSSGDVAEIVGVSIPTARNYMRLLEEVGLVTRRLKSANDPTAVWVVTSSIFWKQDFPYSRAT